ncbi:MAG: DUF3137 domain-containing protein [Planctomycetota bacterium]|nr:DUF3137 domain-containing protein [Planctomycetota bacterium]
MGVLVLVAFKNGNIGSSGSGISSRLGMVAIFALAFVMALIFAIYRLYARRVNCVAGKLSGRATQAAALGFSYESQGTTEFRRRFNYLPGIPDSGKIKHVMHGVVANREAVVFEHMYMVYNGSTMMPMSHTVYSTISPDWPHTTISSRGLLSRMIHRLGFNAGLEMENEDFNRRFKVKTNDEDFALMLLTPSMQQFLVEKPNVTWQLTRGRVCLIYGGGLRFDRLERSLQRLETFWSNVAQELDDWQS